MFKNINIIIMSIILFLSFLYSTFIFVSNTWYEDRKLIFNNLTSTSENKLGISNQGFSCKMSSQGFSHEMPKDSLDLTIKDKEINYSPGGKVAQFSSQATLPVETLSICCGTGTIKIYYLDGRVEIPKGVSLPEASRVFWDAVGKAFAEFKKTIISEYEKEKKNE